MTIYEEIEEEEEDAELQANSKYALPDEKEYYHIRAEAFREVLELFDKRERPQMCEHGYYRAEDIHDFLPPERK